MDIANWKEFRFDDLFIIKKGFYNKKPEHTKIGTIPFLGATDKNNGITEYYAIEDIENASKTGNENNVDISNKIFPKNSLCITNNGSVGYAYYQEKEFTCSHDVNPLYLKKGSFNRRTAMFIATVIMHDKYRWNYGRKWRPERMKNYILKLPIDEDGNPDWNYMENFIESIEKTKGKNGKDINDCLCTINDYSLTNILDVGEWKEFKLDDLFDSVYKAKAYVKGELKISESNRKGYIPFITRTENDNACDCYVSLEDIDTYEKGNALIIGDTTSTIFYQKEDFATGDHIVVCRGSWINEYTGLFLKSVIEKERYRYCYGRAFKMDLIKNTRILLPATREGNVDFDFMESYIKSLPFGDKII